MGGFYDGVFGGLGIERGFCGFCGKGVAGDLIRILLFIHASIGSTYGEFCPKKQCSL